MTPSDAVSALTVSRPKEGWQSMRMTSYFAIAGAEHPLQGLLARHLVHQLHLSRGQVDVGRQQVHAGHAGGDDDLVEPDVLLHQQVVDRQLHVVRVEPQADRERTLGVEVDEQHLAAELRQRRPEVDGGRRLADATLLVAHRDDPCVAVSGQRLRVGQVGHRTTGGPERRLGVLGGRLHLGDGGARGGLGLRGLRGFERDGFSHAIVFSGGRGRSERSSQGRHLVGAAASPARHTPEDSATTHVPHLALSTRRLVSELAGDSRPLLRHRTIRTRKPPAHQGNLLMSCVRRGV